MRKLIIIGIAVAVLFVGAIAYLVVTTPKTALPLRFPLTPAQQLFVSRVPENAEAFAFVPTVAVVHAKLLANPVTQEPLLAWADRQPLPRSWILGGADLLVWRTGKATSFAVRFDPVRATLVRIWTTIAGPHDATWDGHVMLIGDAPAPSHPIDLALASGLPEGDAFVVQRVGARGAFPPIGRPAFSSVRITAADFVIASRARTDAPAGVTPIRASFPRGAMLSVAFATPPRILGDMNRVLGTDINDLVAEGGSIAVYDVDAGLLIPRPEGVITVAAGDRARAALAEYRKYVDLVGEAREFGGVIAVSFDRGSIDRYVKDEMVPAAWPATRWSARVTPATLLPVLRRLGDSPGLRFAAPRIHRSARDLRNWMGALERAESIEAAESVIGDVEELRVRVASK